MSQVSHPTISVRTQLRAHRVAGLAAAVGSRPSIGPSESRVAASVGGGGTVRPTGGPDESRVAASLAKPQQATSGPDEAATAASISGR